MLRKGQLKDKIVILTKRNLTNDVFKPFVRANSGDPYGN